MSKITIWEDEYEVPETDEESRADSEEDIVISDEDEFPESDGDSGYDLEEYIVSSDEDEVPESDGDSAGNPEDRLILCDVGPPALPSSFMEIPHNDDFRTFLDEKLSLLRKLETRTSERMKATLEDLDTNDYKKEFQIFTTQTFKGMMLGDQPPTPETILSLPSAFDLPPEVLGDWMLDYIQLWQNDNGISYAYVGSALSIIYGAYHRITGYRSLFNVDLKELEPDKTGLADKKKMGTDCKKIARKGYKLIHMGVTLIAQRNKRPPHLAAYMKGMEGVITYSLWTHWGGTRRSQNLHYLRKMCPWDVTKLPYNGLNTRNPLTEGIRNLPHFTKTFFDELPTDLSKRSSFLAKWHSRRRRDLVAAKERGEISSSDEEYQEVMKKREKLRGWQRELRAKRKAKYPMKGQRQREVMAKKEKGEIGSSDEEYRKILKERERGKKDGRKHRDKEKAKYPMRGQRYMEVMAKKEKGEIGSSDEEYRKVLKQKERERKANQIRTQRRREVMAKKEKGEIGSSDEEYRKLIKRREDHRTGRARIVAEKKAMAEKRGKENHSDGVSGSEWEP